jgi:hypothetical protein
MANSVARAWVLLALALALHVLDEAVNGFLPIWNSTVAVIQARLPWLWLPTFSFGIWLGGLIAGVLVMLALAPFVAKGAAWTRPIAWFLAVVMIGNALGHTLGTIFGRTVESVRFARPMPGFYSSPFLLAAAVFLILRLRGRAAASGRPIVFLHL